MSLIDGTLAEFGRTLGLDDLSFDHAGVVSLSISELGELFWERLDDQVLIYLVQEVPEHDQEVLVRALRACHWEHNHPFQINAAMRHSNGLVFSVRLQERECTLPTIEQLLQLLGHLHETVREGSIT